ncbi:MAG: 2-hydroxyacyl-CoA dehydratase [Deltaproteobacteria bacterium]|nr:2-hydroxyacyl-CoA dehydratase [Deltaproteobacteria bacterium]
MEDFKKIYDNRHTYMQEWKEKNPDWKVMGYMCSYMPEEILYAAKVLPVRMLGGHEPQNVTEPHIMGMFCPFCRDVLAQGLLGKYDYCDAIGITHTCKHLNQAFESMVLHKDMTNFFIPMPNKLQAKQALPYYSGILGLFKKQMEEWTGNTITDDDLKRGIEIVDENRRLMRDVYETRKAEDPPISGVDSMVMVCASQMYDKVEVNKIIADVLKNELPGRQAKDDPGIRLMILGSENDDVKFLNMVEDVGASIVIDDHCTGSRYFWNTTEPGVPGENLMDVIAYRYLKRPACPIKDMPKRTRIPHITGLAQEWDVAGAIVIQQKFCDPHELDKVAVVKGLKDAGFPTLYLEFDVTVPLGPFRIRVEAFLETLGSEDLF